MTMTEMTTAEKRSFTLSINKAKESFLALGKTYSGTIDLYDAFYSHWIASASKLAWLKGREINETFKRQQLPKIEALLFDATDMLIEKQTREVTKKQLRRMAKNKMGRNDLCTCGSNKKYKKCCLLQTV